MSAHWTFAATTDRQRTHAGAVLEGISEDPKLEADVSRVGTGA